MGAKDALCKVATMNIGLEDTLAYYSPEELPGGTKSDPNYAPLCTYQGIVALYIRIYIYMLYTLHVCTMSIYYINACVYTYI